MAVVIDMAHKVDETCQNSVPSKDRIVDTVIFHLSDIVAITALNVDLDYATKGKSLVISSFLPKLSERRFI